MTPEEIFGKAWDILVEHAGASKDPENREAFIRAFVCNKPRADEWRFGGYLGMGGKFWRGWDRYYVSCYPEDRNLKRTAIMAKVDRLLSELPYFEKKTG